MEHRSVIQIGWLYTAKVTCMKFLGGICTQKDLLVLPRDQATRDGYVIEIYRHANPIEGKSKTLTVVP